MCRLASATKRLTRATVWALLVFPERIEAWARPHP